MKQGKRPQKDPEIGAKIKNCLANRRYKQSLHALERIDRRRVSFQDVLFVLETGQREEAKDTYDEAFQNWKYAVRGKTLEDVDENNIVIITVINLTIKDGI